MTGQPTGTATYFDGVSAALQRVTLTLEDSAIAIVSVDGTALARWDYASVEKLPAPEDRLRLGLADSPSTARLDVRDPAFAQAVGQHIGFGKPQHTWDEQRRRRLVVGWSAAAMAAVLVIAVTGLPALAQLLMPFVPRAWETQIGAQIHESQMMLFKGARPFECGTEGPAERAGKEAFLRFFKRMEDAAGLPVPIRPFVVRSPINNAVAFPGGYVHIYMGFINNVQSSDEFAGVIAHELGHVAHRDALRAALHRVGLAYIFGLAVGDVTGSAAILVAATQILNSRYSRSQEAAADSFAVALMERVGADTHRFADYFERLMKGAKKGDFARILASHPANADRIAAIRSASRLPTPRSFLSEADWTAIKQVCSRR